MIASITPADPLAFSFSWYFSTVCKKCGLWSARIDTAGERKKEREAVKEGERRKGRKGSGKGEWKGTEQRGSGKGGGPQ